MTPTPPQPGARHQSGSALALDSHIRMLLAAQPAHRRQSWPPIRQHRTKSIDLGWRIQAGRRSRCSTPLGAASPAGTLVDSTRRPPPSSWVMAGSDRLAAPRTVAPGRPHPFPCDCIHPASRTRKTEVSANAMSRPLPPLTLSSTPVAPPITAIASSTPPHSGIQRCDTFHILYSPRRATADPPERRGRPGASRQTQPRRPAVHIHAADMWRARPGRTW